VSLNLGHLILREAWCARFIVHFEKLDIFEALINPPRNGLLLGAAAEGAGLLGAWRGVTRGRLSLGRLLVLIIGHLLLIRRERATTVRRRLATSGSLALRILLLA
jgi:hypothetical protein